MSLRREKQRLTGQDRVPPESLVEGLEVEAQDGVNAGVYFPGRVKCIDRSPVDSSDQWLVTVHFPSYGDTHTVPLSEIRPKGWADRQKLAPQAAKRQCNQPSFDADASTDTEPNSGTDSESEAAARSVQGRPQRRRTEDSGLVVVTRITDHRIVAGKCEYQCHLASGRKEWLPRETLEDTDVRGLTTTTGALIAYEWTPWYVVQTYESGTEFLVRFLNRIENDWARVPAAAFSHKDLESMQANRPCATELSKKNAVFRLFVGVQQSLRSPSERMKRLDHFPAFEIEAVLHGMGTPVDRKKSRFAGDRVWLSLSREELDPLFSPYRERWDESRSSRGKLWGRIDFSEGKGVQVIWYARPLTVDWYTAAEGRPTWLPLRHPAPYVEYVELKVCAAESTQEEDREAIA